MNIRSQGALNTMDFGVMTPSQYQDANKTPAGETGVRRLMRALLEDAIDVLQNLGKPGVRGKIAEESREWIFNSDPRARFSFENACHTLGFDPDYMRRGAAKYIEVIQADPGKAFHRKQDGGRRIPISTGRRN